MDHAITIVLTPLDKRNGYVRMQFIDYSSAFNTVVPFKLLALGLMQPILSVKQRS